MAAEGSREKNEGIAQLASGVVFHGVYEVVRCIKAGGMGAVYEVLQRNTQRKRALKVMLPSLVTDPEMRARFELEAKIAAGIESEHIVETLDAGVDETTGMPFIVMELLKGEELGRRLKERRRLPPDEVVALLHQAALALDKTHAAGIIHRDLKPENLFITQRDDGTPRLKILDFGVAKIVADGTVSSNSTKSVGSPLYMAPEQISGDQKIGPAVDRYALGHIAFTLLVGKPYWARERKAADGLFPYLMQVMRGAQVPASQRAAEVGVELPPTFDAWFAKATTPTQAERFSGSVEQVAALAEALSVPAPAASSAKATRTPLPSIVATSVATSLGTSAPASEQPASIPPPSAASAETAPAPTLVAAAAKERKIGETIPIGRDAVETNGPPSSSQEPSSAALTRSSAPALDRAGERLEPRKKSSSTVVALLLVIGLFAVGFAFFLWPKRVDPNADAKAATNQAAPKASEQEASAASSAPASPQAADPKSATATATSAPSPSAMLSASAGKNLALPAGSTTFPAPSGSPGTGTNPTWKTKQKPPNGTNPLDEY